jgi:hypothetical protein
MWVCGTYMFVRFKRYFHPGEGRVNRVTTRVWFQDVLTEFRGVGPHACFKYFLLCRHVNMRKGIPMMYVGCFEWERGQRTGPAMVESEKS